MKKFLVLVAAAMMAVVNVNAQSVERRHEIGVSYGLGCSAIFDTFGERLTNGIFDHVDGCKMDNEKEFGTLSVEYFYHFDNPRMAIGGIFGYAHFSEDVVKKDGGALVGDRSRDYFTVMPALKYDWVHKDNFALYSKLGAGVMMLNEKSEDKELKKSDSDNDFFFMWQASLIGLEAGGENVRFFFEAGVGEQGIFLGGLKYKF